MQKLIAAGIAAILIWAGNAEAGGRAQDSAVGGMISGAVIGQVVGRNTEATLIGAALGGVVGYIIGANDAHGAAHVHYPPRPPRERIHVYRPVVIERRPYYRPQRHGYGHGKKHHGRGWGHQRHARFSCR